ncbi:hypothetical protein BKA66DRAFT_433945, partial [Pyrenochaeta sp. MPI-SDFR-AT-0127]
CGPLGVMEVPEGEDPSRYRKCRDHPLSIGDKQGPPDDGVLRPPTTSSANPSCDWSTPYDQCRNERCWSRCNPLESGSWCWTAIDNGNGEWAQCTIHSQCDIDWVTVLSCGGGCGC